MGPRKKPVTTDEIQEQRAKTTKDLMDAAKGTYKLAAFFKNRNDSSSSVSSSAHRKEVQTYASVAAGAGPSLEAPSSSSSSSNLGPEPSSSSPPRDLVRPSSIARTPRRDPTKKIRSNHGATVDMDELAQEFQEMKSPSKRAAYGSSSYYAEQAEDEE
ncbi:hypothetical protein HK102_011792, partial [Quaeritorhiza haematococci]